MKVMVEISDEQVVTFLQDCVKTAIRANMPNDGDVWTKLDIINYAYAVSLTKSLNETINYLGGIPVDVHAVTHR
jgi:hypothetical protein